MIANQQRDGIYGHYLLASGLLGGLFPSIFLFNLEWHSTFSCIVGNVPSSAKFLGFITIVITSLAICRNKNTWICTTKTSVVTNVKIGVLWFLGIVVCIVHQTDNDYHINIFPRLAKTMSVVFITLQILFLTCCSRFVFYESRNVKYTMSLLAVVNMVNWLDTTVLSSIIMTESNFTHLPEHSNSSCINLMHERNQFFLRKLFLLPFDMEFSILATTIVISIPLAKRTKNQSTVSTLRQVDIELDITRHHSSLSGNQRLCVTIASIFLTAPFLFYIIVYPTSLDSISSVMNTWLISVVGAKILVFLLIIFAYYYLYKISSVITRPINLNFNDIALILGSSAVNASGVLTFLFHIDPNPLTITFHTWFNIFYVLYQTVFILFLKCIVIRDKSSPLLIRIRMIVMVLICYNILYWVKDSLYFLSFVKDTVHSSLVRVLFFLMYPFVSFYRFQSAMGLIPFLF